MVAKKFIIVSMKYKGTEITYRRWFDGGKEEILINKNTFNLFAMKDTLDSTYKLLKDIY